MEYGFNSVTVDHDNSPANSQDSPSSSMFKDTKATSSSSPKRSRRSIQKRVVSVPINKEIQGSRLKGGDANAPPSDSWAWRKYGQKPIKGSPYPRAYYRCSSSKGCPARKQVERSRADPTMVMVTYSCDHNHRWPASRNNNHNSTVSPPAAAEEPLSNPDDQEEDPPLVTKQLVGEYKEKFTGLEVCPSDASFVTITDQFGWFSELESPSSTMFEFPLMVGDIVEDADMAMILIREEDESLFADLGELPECTTVFSRSREIINDDKHQRRPCNLAT